METITRSVKDIAAIDRAAIEHVIGQPLSESQHIIIQVLNANAVPPAHASAEAYGIEQHVAEKGSNPSAQLPPWCNVYEGLTDSQVTKIESSIVRSHDSRSFR
jgi:hypothetical protein